MEIKNSRGTLVPFKIFEGNKKGPLVVFIHGFKSNMDEDGRYTKIAKELKNEGINSIMFSQANCGESKEDFINYTIDNIIDDLDCCIKYMLDNFQIDKNNISFVGYSMGGRIASLVSNRYKAKSLVMIAAANFKGFPSSGKFLGQDINKLKEEANKNGYAIFYNQFDDEYLKMNKIFLDNMEEYDPTLELNKYNGDILLIHGLKDDIVKVEVTYNVFNNLDNIKSKRLIIFKDSDHSFGGWSINRNKEESDLLCFKIIDFLKEKIGE